MTPILFQIFKNQKSFVILRPFAAMPARSNRVRFRRRVCLDFLVSFSCDFVVRNSSNLLVRKKTQSKQSPHRSGGKDGCARLYKEMHFAARFQISGFGGALLGQYRFPPVGRFRSTTPRSSLHQLPILVRQTGVFVNFVDKNVVRTTIISLGKKYTIGSPEKSI